MISKTTTMITSTLIITITNRHAVLQLEFLVNNNLTRNGSIQLVQKNNKLNNNNNKKRKSAKVIDSESESDDNNIINKNNNNSTINNNDKNILNQNQFLLRDNSFSRL